MQPPRQQRMPLGKFRSVGEERGLVVAAVAIGVFENAHAAAGLAVAVHAERIIRHLHDPQTPALIPVERHGIEHQRFRGDQLDFESLGHMNFLERFLRRERPRFHLWLWQRDGLPSRRLSAMPLHFPEVPRSRSGASARSKTAISSSLPCESIDRARRFASCESAAAFKAGALAGHPHARAPGPPLEPAPQSATHRPASFSAVSEFAQRQAGPDDPQFAARRSTRARASDQEAAAALRSRRWPRRARTTARSDALSPGLTSGFEIAAGEMQRAIDLVSPENAEGFKRLAAPVTGAAADTRQIPRGSVRNLRDRAARHGVRCRSSRRFIEPPVGNGLRIEHRLRIGSVFVCIARRCLPVTSSSAPSNVSTIFGSACTSSPAVRAGQVV